MNVRSRVSFLPIWRRTPSGLQVLSYRKWKNVGLNVHSSMTLDNRIRRMQLLAVSKELAQRQRPAILYAILAVLAVTAFSYEVCLAYQNFPSATSSGPKLEKSTTPRTRLNGSEQFIFLDRARVHDCFGNFDCNQALSS